MEKRDSVASICFQSPIVETHSKLKAQQHRRTQSSSTPKETYNFIQQTLLKSSIDASNTYVTIREKGHTSSIFDFSKPSYEIKHKKVETETTKNPILHVKPKRENISTNFDWMRNNTEILLKKQETKDNLDIFGFERKQTTSKLTSEVQETPKTAKERRIKELYGQFKDTKVASNVEMDITGEYPIEEHIIKSALTKNG